MRRSLIQPIQADLNRKIILVSGARQCGKTTLAKMLGEPYDYLNFDVAEHRIAIIEKSWDRKKPIIILDELHKLKKWKSYLKGIYDDEGIPPGLVITGSAKLDTYKKVGDSLAGRFFSYRLHPFDLAELAQIDTKLNTEKTLTQLLLLGGFPEPFLDGRETYYKRWRRSHLDIILRQDLLDLESVHEITSIETLVQLLRKRVGSPVSYASLARDLQCNDKTVRRWLSLLESMYVIFKVTPYHRNVARSLLKSAKYYFFDNGLVQGDQGTRLENLVACALLKQLHFLQDCLGRELELFYLRNKDGREVDFLISENLKPILLVEVKWADNTVAPSIGHFASMLHVNKAIQIVKELPREKTFASGLEIRRAANWLASLPSTL
ncbi:MAG: ATP-binding protein [Deltaproteobacteria bacterium]|nr:ATP-binding protein [Deltaproteobacteria bacterium]